MSTGTPAILPRVTRKYFRFAISASATAFRQLGRGRTLQRERRNLLRNILDLHVHVQAVLPEPAQARIGGSPAIDVLFQARDRAVVDDLALFIAPAAIDHLPDFDLVDVARDHAVHQARRVLAGDQVLVERRNIDERARVANGVVLVLVMHLVHADGVVSRPFAVVQAVAKGKSALVKCSSDGQSGFLACELGLYSRTATTATAALDLMTPYRRV